VKHAVLCIFAAVLATLTLLALDDVTTGSEPDLSVEYIIIGVSIVYFSFFIPYIYKILRKRHNEEATTESR